MLHFVLKKVNWPLTVFSCHQLQKEALRVNEFKNIRWPLIQEALLCPDSVAMLSSYLCRRPRPNHIKNISGALFTPFYSLNLSQLYPTGIQPVRVGFVSVQTVWIINAACRDPFLWFKANFLYMAVWNRTAILVNIQILHICRNM